MTAPTDANLLAGSTALFTCVATGIPDPAFSWFRGNSEITVDDRHNITMTTEVVEDVTFVTSVLKICELDYITDVATFTCVATVPRFTDSASFELDVRAIHAAIITGPTDITVVIGTEVSLMCQADGAPLPSFSWTLGGAAAEGEITETVVGVILQ